MSTGVGSFPGPVELLSGMPRVCGMCGEPLRWSAVALGDRAFLVAEDDTGRDVETWHVVTCERNLFRARVSSEGGVA